MAHNAICDNEGCGRQAPLAEPYKTTPDGWFTLTEHTRHTQMHACSIACLRVLVANTEARVDAEAAAEALKVAARAEALAVEAGR